jgi:hypothetical protein
MSIVWIIKCLKQGFLIDLMKLGVWGRVLAERTIEAVNSHWPEK